jgi:hypothetical protein
MKCLASTLCLSALFMLCGCQGATHVGGPAPTGGTPLPVPALDVSGNWQFNTVPAVPGNSPLALGGNVSQSGKSLSGMVHVDNSNCFDQLNALGLSGSLTGSILSLTSATVDGQVVTLTGSILNDDFTGKFAIKGGCADGDQGDVSGVRIPALNTSFSATFTTPANDTFDATASLTQGSATTEGSFGVDGTMSFTTPCFKTGSISSGMFPSASFVLGSSVALEIKTNNGTIAIVGTVDKGDQISGDFTVSGGSCDQSGTALLVATPWNY